MDRKEKLQQLLKLRPAARPETARPPAPAPPPEVPARRKWSAANPSSNSAGLHGNVPLAAAGPVTPQLFHLAGLPLDMWSEGLRLAFLDAETTGLAGGTGTYIFLMGLGFLDPGQSGAGPAPALPAGPGRRGSLSAAGSGQSLPHATCWICFNGKSYDLPLLQTRLHMNRPGTPARRPTRARPALSGAAVLETPAGQLHPPEPGARSDRVSPPGRPPRRAGAGDVLPLPAGSRPGFPRTGVRAQPAGPDRHGRPPGAAQPEDVAGRRASTATPWTASSAACWRAAGRRSSGISTGDHAPRWHEEARRHLGLARTLALLCKRAGFREESYGLFTHLSTHRPRQAPESLEAVLIHEEHFLKDARTGAPALR